MRSIKDDARAWRLQQAVAFVEDLEIEDPETGEQVPVYEPVPNQPGAYRKTARAQEIESRRAE